MLNGKNVALTCSTSLVNIRDPQEIKNIERKALIKKASLPNLLCSQKKKAEVDSSYGSAETAQFQHSTENVVGKKSEEFTQNHHVSNQSNQPIATIVEMESGDAKIDSQTRLLNGSHGTSSGSPSKSNTCENCGHELTKLSQTSSFIESPRSNCSLFSIYNQQSSYEFCRICHCAGEVNNPLIAPCRCKGSMTHVHHSCLERWIKSSGHKFCELCGFHFMMKAKLKRITKWKALDMSKTERRKLYCSVFFHVVAITCVIWSLYVLIEKTALELQNGSLHWPFWTKLAVVAVGLTGGIAFMYVQCKTYYKWCNKLLTFNKIIRVENRPIGPVPLDGSADLPPDDLSSCSISLANDNRADPNVIIT